MADELARFGVQALGRLKIVRHTVAQQLGLADVDDPAGLVLVHIYARLHGSRRTRSFSCSLVMAGRSSLAVFVPFR